MITDNRWINDLAIAKQLKTTKNEMSDLTVDIPLGSKFRRYQLHIAIYPLNKIQRRLETFTRKQHFRTFHSGRKSLRIAPVWNLSLNLSSNGCGQCKCSFCDFFTTELWHIYEKYIFGSMMLPMMMTMVIINVWPANSGISFSSSLFLLLFVDHFDDLPSSFADPPVVIFWTTRCYAKEKYIRENVFLHFLFWFSRFWYRVYCQFLLLLASSSSSPSVHQLLLLLRSYWTATQTKRMRAFLLICVICTATSCSRHFAAQINEKKINRINKWQSMI